MDQMIVDSFMQTLCTCICILPTLPLYFSL